MGYLKLLVLLAILGTTVYAQLDRSDFEIKPEPKFTGFNFQVNNCREDTDGKGCCVPKGACKFPDLVGLNMELAMLKRIVV